MTHNRGRRLLVVRNDKLGDFMLAWPALACLKRAHPDNHVTVLVPSYTAPLARRCPWVDAVILDPGDGAPRQARRQLLAVLREARFDGLLTLFSTPRIGWLGWRASIPLRMAPATKWAQLFYNQRVTQRRSRSARPEYRYNLELAAALLRRFGQTAPEVAPPFWPLVPHTRTQQRQRLVNELALVPSRAWAFLHAGSGGSAVNLSIEQYATLVQRLESQLSHPVQWVLTAGPGEADIARRLADRLDAVGIEAALMPPRHGLDDFAVSLAAADLFIAGSTGPLHIAGCLDLPTVGFYPAKRSATPLRWQTCNADERRLAFCPPTAHGEASDMARIDLAAVAREIAAWWPTPAAGSTATDRAHPSRGTS